MDVIDYIYEDNPSGVIERLNQQDSINADVINDLLYKCCLCGSPRCITTLLRFGANPNHLIESSHSLLHVVVLGPDEDAELSMSELITFGAKVDARTDILKAGHDWTPLMLSAHQGGLAGLNGLLRHGASVDMVDFEGRTALMLSVMQIRDVVPKVQALLKYGAAPGRRSRAGLSAIEYATEYKVTLSSEPTPVLDDALRWMKEIYNDKMKAIGMSVDSYPFPDIQGGILKSIEAMDEVIGLLSQ